MQQGETVSVNTRMGIRNGIRQTLNILRWGLALEAMDRKQVTALVLLDLSKVFDGIDHMSLSKKLHAMGTSKEVMEWCRSYLTRRNQSLSFVRSTTRINPGPGTV